MRSMQTHLMSRRKQPRLTKQTQAAIIVNKEMVKRGRYGKNKRNRVDKTQVAHVDRYLFCAQLVWLRSAG
jgi:hypothetical protein